MKLLKNPEDAFSVGFVVVMLKFLLGGLTIAGYHIPDFSGSDFALALGAVGSIYSLSKHVGNLAKRKAMSNDKSED